MVVFGHFLYQNNLPIINKAVYSFYIVLLFRASGFVIRSEGREKIGEFVKKQTIRLLPPAFSFVILFLPVYFMTADGLIFGKR